MTTTLERAFAITREIVATIVDDDLDRQTPCVSWTVRDLMNHVAYVGHWAAVAVSTGVGPPVDPKPDFSGRLLEVYDEGIEQSLAAFSVPGALDKTVALPIGVFPAAVFMDMVALDQFTHGWDLAKATGRSTDLDPDIAEEVLRKCEERITDEFRGPDGVAAFAPIVAVPASACAADRLAGFLGRRI